MRIVTGKIISGCGSVGDPMEQRSKRQFKFEKLLDAVKVRASAAKPSLRIGNEIFCGRLPSSSAFDGEDRLEARARLATSLLRSHHYRRTRDILNRMATLLLTCVTRISFQCNAVPSSGRMVWNTKSRFRCASPGRWFR